MEEDNYINYTYATDLTHSRSLKEIMILTGNSTHRIPQLYLSNPNTLYSVTIETMVAVIDENQTFFIDTANQIGTTYTDLTFTSIQTWIVNESIIIYDNSNPPNALTYLTLNTIEIIEQQGTILIIKDLSIGHIFLQFKTLYDANQSHAAISYVITHPNTVIGGNYSPIIYFRDTFAPSGNYIDLNGLTSSVPYNSTEGLTFSSSTDLVYYGGTISADTIISSAIDHVFDGISSDLIITSSHILIDGNPYTTGITVSGTYSISFNISNGSGLSINPELKLNLTVN